MGYDRMHKQQSTQCDIWTGMAMWHTLNLRQFSWEHIGKMMIYQSQPGFGATDGWLRVWANSKVYFTGGLQHSQTHPIVVEGVIYFG